MTRDTRDWRNRARAILARVSPAVIWDVAMVNLAALNLCLLCFDVSYLWLRSWYLDHVPVVAGVYDPVKGIDPDPLIERYLGRVEKLAATVPGGRQAILAELRQLDAELDRYQPFLRSGQYRELRVIEARIREHVGDLVGVEGSDLPVEGLLNRLWTPANAAELGRTLEFFDAEIRPVFRLAYRRELDRTGEYADYGWLVDLPFLVLFSIEFYGRWIAAVRRRTYPRWFVFPILHWYDFLGILPFPELRIFRLFRIGSIYLRLSRSDHSRVGDDVLSRSARYVADVASEEISAKTTVWILEDIQAKIDAGVHRRIIRGVLDQRQAAIARSLADGVRRVIGAQSFRADARQFLDANLERAADGSPSLRRIPLPKALLRPLVGAVGRIVFDATLETLGETLDSADGRRALEEMLAGAVDGLVEELTEGEMEALFSELVQDSLEQMKATVSVRQWVRALEPGARARLPRES